MSFYRPFGEHAAFFVVGAIALGLMMGIGVPLWVYPLVFAGLYVLIYLPSALLVHSENRQSRKINKQRLKEEEHCSKLIRQAFNACAGAAAEAPADQKSWLAPTKKEVRQAIFNPDVDLPELFEILQAAWSAGEREPELAFHLMYTSWDLQEQSYDEYTSSLPDQTLQKGFQQPYAYLGGNQSNNCTLLLTAGHMILLFDYRTGLTLADARACLERFLEICPDGIPLSEFEHRGHFGDYFTHIIAVQ